LRSCWVRPTAAGRGGVAVLLSPFRFPSRSPTRPPSAQAIRLAGDAPMGVGAHRRSREASPLHERTAELAPEGSGRPVRQARSPRHGGTSLQSREKVRFVSCPGVVLESGWLHNRYWCCMWACAYSRQTRRLSLLIGV
jgi:hypothetical protein